MRQLFGGCVFALLILLISTTFTQAQSKRGPLSESELIALVAGNSLSEDVVIEIQTRGLAFQPSAPYRSLVTDAGGDARVLAALQNAKITDAGAGPDSDAADQLLRHLSVAGKLMRNKQYEQAAAELNAAMQSGGGPETGFVMGGLLYKQEQWPQAAGIYAELLRRDPDFTEAQMKLSYAVYRMGDSEEALRIGRLALANAPNSAEAHRYVGVALYDLQKYTSAEQEYREALRLKPDYAAAHYDLAIMFEGKKDLNQSIAEYKKSIALDPTDERAHYNLANNYSDKGDSDSAMREYREAIRINPSMLWARQNLGKELISRNMNAEAVVEFRAMEKVAPDSAMCHECLGTALFRTWDFEGAREEYRRAIELDPTDSEAHLGLGTILEHEKSYDAALQEYRLAERIDGTKAEAFRLSGRVLLTKKDIPQALKELKSAENLDPSSASIHELFGKALQASGDIPAAIAEFKQAIALEPKQAQFKLELASAEEKNGDWSGALEQFHLAALADPSTVGQAPYQLAQERLKQHIASLRAAGKSADAKALEGQIRESKVEPGISEKLDAAMEAGWNAMGKNHLDEAEAQYKQAADLAEKMQPHDERLATSLIRLSSIYSFKKDFPRVDATLQRALAANVELYGPESAMITEPLRALGLNAIFHKDYKTALDYFSRAVDVNEKTFGEASNQVADNLRFMAQVYLVQGAYDKAEPYLLRAVHINESIFGAQQSTATAVPLWELCSLYDKWGKPEKAEPRYRQMLAILEKQYSPDSPVLLSTLTGEANALRKLGRDEEAEKVERRMQTIRAATGQSDELAPAPHP